MKSPLLTHLSVLTATVLLTGVCAVFPVQAASTPAVPAAVTATETTTVTEPVTTTGLTTTETTTAQPDETTTTVTETATTEPPTTTTLPVPTVDSPTAFLNTAAGYAGEIVTMTLSLRNNPGFDYASASVCWTATDAFSVLCTEDGGLPVLTPGDAAPPAQALVAERGESSFRIYTDNDALWADDGVAVQFSFVLSPDAQPGNYPILLVPDAFTREGEAVPFAVASAVLTVLPAAVAPQGAGHYLINRAITRAVPMTAAMDACSDGKINAFDSVAAKRFLLQIDEAAAPKLSFADITTYPGGEAALTLSIANNPGFSHALLELTLAPDSPLQPGDADGTLLLDDAAPTDGVSWDSVGANGVYYLYTTSDAVSSADGALVHAAFRVAEDAAPGTYVIYLRASGFGTADTAIPVTTANVRVTVTDKPPETVTTTTIVYDSKPDPLTRGIDVSRWQNEIDWTAVKQSGTVDFSIIRAGYGKEYDQVDTTFHTNMKAAQAQGIGCGAYWFSYATTVAAARQEAQVFLDTIAGYSFEYPLVFDLEAEEQKTLDKATITAIVDAFCGTVQDAGYYCVLYSYASFLNNFVDVSVLRRYDVWVAHTGVSKPAYTEDYGMWQYSHTGTVSGISGSCDMNYAYRDYPAMMKEKHLNGY